MTLAHGNPAQDMHELLLRVLGGFSHLQICIDEMVARAFFSKRMPMASRACTHCLEGSIRCFFG